MLAVLGRLWKGAVMAPVDAAANIDTAKYLAGQNVREDGARARRAAAAVTLRQPVAAGLSDGVARR